MTPKPLHRSITLWSGIFMMLFIAWAWRDSMKMVSHLSYGRTTSFSLGSMMGIEIRPVSGPPDSGRVPLEKSLFGPTVAASLPPPLFLRGEAQKSGMSWIPGEATHKHFARYTKIEPKGYRAILIPYWIPLMLSVLIWSGLLLWRAKRHRPAGHAVLTESSA
ncbi:hypothetical protein [Luteolibacter luteus]|uniref:Uncharacterized protein n=1 Tax=Luteolibacter luteus TaxID=2728835 RepID=A0A858RRJ5_9BACT|nr:hypothetical protein [Luteolibacter luteus]QJE99038.1 hypothetical protein HHL09_25745 [Luteolibacter luteus]